MAGKFYVVWIGIVPGIYRSWEQCKAQVHKYPGAKYKSFATEAEAETAFLNKPSKARKPKKSKPKSKDKKVKKSNQTNKRIKTYDEIEINSLQVDTKIFSDGACIPNPGESGSGLAVYRSGNLEELWYGLYDSNGTNNTAELKALHQALILAAEEISKNQTVAIFTDSIYSLQAVTQWAAGWKKKGWKKSGGEIKNLELIKMIFDLYQTLSDKINVLHVNGHVGVQGNELADRMSMMAIESCDDEFVLYRGGMTISELLALRTG